MANTRIKYDLTRLDVSQVELVDLTAATLRSILPWMVCIQKLND